MPLYFAHSRQRNLSLMSTNTLSAITQSNHSGLWLHAELGYPANSLCPALPQRQLLMDTGTRSLCRKSQRLSVTQNQAQGCCLSSGERVPPSWSTSDGVWLLQVQPWVGTGCQTEERPAGTLHWPLVPAWWLPQMDSGFWGVARDITGPAG